MCTWRPGPRCAADTAKDLARARAEFERTHPFDALPDLLMDSARRMQALDADYSIARANARSLSRAVRAARASGADVADLETQLDRELCQALAVRENLTGIYEEREVTRREHLDRHAAAVLDDQPADTAPEPEAGPVRTDAWDPKTGRHKVTGTKFDEEGYDQRGFHRRTRRDALGYHELTGTMLSPSGHLPDGTHYTEAGIDPAHARIGTADDVVADPAFAAAEAERHAALQVDPLRPRHSDIDDLRYNGNGTVNADAAAALLGTSRVRVDSMVASGRLTSPDDGRISAQDLARVAHEHVVEHAERLAAAGVPRPYPLWSGIAWMTKRHGPNHRLTRD